MVSDPTDRVDRGEGPGEPEVDERSDLKVVMQFFIVPLALVMVLVSVFFGLQFLRSRNPDPQTTLRSLAHYEGFLARFVGDLKRWQYGYDLSLQMRGENADTIRQMLPELMERFREAGTRGDLKLRRYLALALGSSGDARASEALREGLDDADPQTRLFSAWGLSEVGDRMALPDLRAALDDPDPGVRKMAIFGLGRMGDSEDAPRLRAALEDSVLDVRWNAALALARLGDVAAIPALVDLLDMAVRAPPVDSLGPRVDREELAINSIRGLALLDDPEAKAALRRVAADRDGTRIGDAARMALASRGSDGVGLP